eukprot:CAMPEP_0181276950 /NCGR_PEP_ID=MMETSP1097-20121128/10802_1 /TAXON_ID=35684 /ORGANISM="Pseudopedinella elastica, Strain CCMP716" /LENGTH=38 /DNA_ID= /DNA_START= /DNA_END= /DNA_ORIENTATION=
MTASSSLALSYAASSVHASRGTKGTSAATPGTAVGTLN